MRSLAVLALVACGGSGDSATRSGLPGGLPGSGSGSVTTPPGVRCVQRETNVLLWDCDVVLPNEGPAAAFLEESDGGLRALPLDQSGDRASIAVWRLHAESDYAVRVQPSGGPELTAEFTTGPLPSAVTLAPVVSGSPSFGYILVPQQCDGPPFLLLLDGQGEVVWYLNTSLDTTGFPGFIDGFHADEDGVIAVLGRNRLRAWRWTQELDLDATWPGDLPHPIHHDVVRRDGLIHVLFAEGVTASDGGEYVLDGILVLDEAGGEVARWRMADHFEPTGAIPGASGFWQAIFPGHTDWSHSNGIEVTPDGDWLLSARARDSVIRIDGDWTSPGFGDIVWAASSAADGGLGTDLAFQGSISPPDFQDQHHPNLDSAGRMLLFDNRQSIADPSRATVWSVDAAARTLTLEHAWSMGEHCAVQGSAFPVGSDHVVATCADSQQIHEFAVGRADPVWSLKPRCASLGLPSLVVRAMPLDF